MGVSLIASIQVAWPVQELFARVHSSRAVYGCINPGDRRGDRRDESSSTTRSQPDVGLCERCLHSRRIPSSRGSVFYLCALSATDAAFPKYPRLPVVRCTGYSQKT